MKTEKGKAPKPGSSDEARASATPAKPSPTALSDVGKWIPGPWAWADYIDEVDPATKTPTMLVAYGPEDDYGNQPITEILFLDSEAIAIHPGTARLIAAAPELYEALAWLVGRADPTGPSSAAMLAVARAALAKARGETE